MKPRIEIVYSVIEGFASIVDETFFWNQWGLNIIQAPNGYGKTKFINALVWCLFGKTLTGSVETWEHLRTEEYKGTKVCTELIMGDDLIEITRYKNYSKFKNSLILKINGKEKDLGKGDTQKQIDQILGYTYDLFKNSIVFGQKLKRIISETGPNKKKVFDEAFEVTYIPKAKKIAEDKKKVLLEEFHKLEIEVARREGEVNAKQAEINAQQALIDGFEARKQNSIAILDVQITGLRKKLKKKVKKAPPRSTMDQYLSEKEAFEKDLYSEDEMTELNTSVAVKESTIKRAEVDGEGVLQEIDKIKKSLKNIPKLCSNCGKAYSEKEIEEERKRLKDKLTNKETDYNNLIDTIGNLRGQIKELTGDISSAERLSKEYNLLLENISKLEDVFGEIDQIKNDIRLTKKDREKKREEVLENNLEQLEIELTDLKSQHEEKDKELRLVKRDISLYEWVIKDPLSNAGIKAFVFNLMLDDINEKLEFYSRYIGFQVAFYIDMESANKNLETYVFIDDNPVPYEDLSGGQQQAVDIASAFAIHDIVSDTKSCNLLIMDEVFESLDKNNVEIIADIIQDKAQDKCLYLITHLSEFNPTNANIISIDYVNGATSLS